MSILSTLVYHIQAICRLRVPEGDRDDLALLRLPVYDRQFFGRAVAAVGPSLPFDLQSNPAMLSAKIAFVADSMAEGGRK